MPSKSETIVVLTILSFVTVFGQAPSKGPKRAGQISQVLPAILSGDQSLPANGAFPVDAMPTDLKAGGINQMQSHVVPIVANNMNAAGGNIAHSNTLSGQAEYPVAMEQVNNVAVPGQSNNIQNFNQLPEMQRLPNTAINGMNHQPQTVPVPPMNMYYQPWTSTMSVNMVLRNIQMACSTLQNFVLGTPLAREITASVSNMNNMAEIFNSPKQCGFPALSTTLRVFLKTCNIYSDCSNPSPGTVPVPAQPISPEVPYNVQQQRMSKLNPQVVPQPRQVSRQPVTPPPFLRQQFQAFQTQIMMMFNWLHNNFRSSSQQQTTPSKSQQKKANNATTVPFDD